MSTAVFSNSTVLSQLEALQPQSLIETFKSISTIQPQLNPIESAWAAWYVWMANDVLATGLIIFLWHEIVYFGRALPWFIIDRIPYFRKWKIQPTRIPSDKEQWECFKSVMISHIIVEAMPIWTFHPMCTKIGMSISAQFPAWTDMALQLAIFFVAEDMYHYWAHRLFHYGVFYKYIHKQHHRYAAPFGITAEYAHPLETLLLGIGTIGSPLLYCYITGEVHFFTITLWITLRLFQAIDAHSGYHFPWSLSNFIPFWAGAEHHDLHHHYFIGNYASSFRWWDFSLDTEAGPEAKKEREERMKKRAELKAKKAN